MPTPKLETTLKTATQKISGLQSKANIIDEIPVAFRAFVAELILIRLFEIFLESISDSAFKIVCGSPYINGKNPNINVRAKSLAEARIICKSHNRNKPLTYLRWSSSRFIKNSVSKVIDQGDPFLININAHNNIIKEMRSVRNYIAHRNADARKNYKDVLMNVYGSHPKIPPGVFLVSESMVNRRKLDEYIISSKIILNDITRGW